MKVLIACEYSGIVRDAFIRKGHNAISCDILPTESPGPHYQGDVLNILNDGFDLLIAHPPCTYLSYAAAHVWDTPGRAELREAAFDFFMTLYNAPIPRVAIENPVGYPNSVFRRPNQIVRPYYFGESLQKNICLWTRNLPPLHFWGCAISPKPEPVYIRKSGPRAGKKIHLTEALHGGKSRSLFFKSVADNMAAQWGSL